MLSVSEKSEEYAREVEQKLSATGLRVTGDYRGEKLGAKIRDAQLSLIPYMLVAGPRDVEQGTVSVRDRIEGDLGAMDLADAMAKFQEEIAAKTVRQSFTESAGLGEGRASEDYYAFLRLEEGLDRQSVILVGSAAGKPGGGGNASTGSASADWASAVCFSRLGLGRLGLGRQCQKSVGEWIVRFELRRLGQEVAG